MKPSVAVLTDIWPSESQPHNGPFVEALTIRLAEWFHEVVLVPRLLLPRAHRRVWGRDVQGWQRDHVRPDADVRVLSYSMLRVPRGTETAARAWGVRVALRRERPQLVHAHFLYGVGPAAARLARKLDVPVLLTAHGTDVRWLADRRDEIRPRDHAEMVAAAREADGVTVVAEWMVEHLVAAGVRNERIAVIPMGVDEQVFHPQPPSDGEERRVLFVGRATKEKGAEVLREALAGLDGVRCYVAGQFPIDGCTHLGMLDPPALADWMASADLVCLPSFSEGMPVAVSEALACGTPVVASAVGGLVEQVQPDVNGLLVPPGDADALRSAIRAALERSWDPARIRATSERFWWSSVAQRFREQYERLLSVR